MTQPKSIGKKTSAKKQRKKPAKKGGAPSKYTKERIEKILDLIRGGNFKTVAARICGITNETLSKWEKNKDGFSDAIKEAESACEAMLIERIVTARSKNGTPEWTASAWMLERKNFNRWGKKEKREISGSLDTSTPEQTEEAVVKLFESNPELWDRVKGQVENE